MSGVASSRRRSSRSSRGGGAGGSGSVGGSSQTVMAAAWWTVQALTSDRQPALRRLPRAHDLAGVEPFVGG